MENTIAAIATPPGTGGIGIVRLSGAEAIAIADTLFRPVSGGSLTEAAGYTGLLGRVHGPDGDVDEAIAIVYRAPKSYTGEDVVELSCHGGPWILQRVLRLCLDAGAQLAGPGEFTKRAFLNGKMTLDQAEAVMELVSAKGEAQRKAALSARDGALTEEIETQVELLTAIAAELAAWADDPDGELEPNPAAIARCLSGARALLDELLREWDRGHLIRDGIQTAIVGRPNVGKSTLMNLLAGRRRSIVADIPGTTRDVVEDTVMLGDYCLCLSDTAGLRDAPGPVERMGVELAWGKLEEADLVLAVFDASDALDGDDRRLLERLKDSRAVAVINKTDLPVRVDRQAVAAAVAEVVDMAAKTGEGREQLERAVLRVLGLDALDPAARRLHTERQRSQVTLAAEALAGAEDAVHSGVTFDVVALYVEDALAALLTLTGRRASDLVIDQVFERFCIGK